MQGGKARQTQLFKEGCLRLDRGYERRDKVEQFEGKFQKSLRHGHACATGVRMSAPAKFFRQPVKTWIDADQRWGLRLLNPLVQPLAV
jgi:hypothetical protein